jgi:spoIIIJ-associated protein
MAAEAQTNLKLTAKELKTAEVAIEKLFSLLEIKGTFELSQNEDDMLDIVMDTEDSGMVIGYHGEGLESLQLIISLIVAKKLGKFIRVSIEVDGYKKNRTEYLERLAQQMKERALEENREQVAESLKSWERRIVHMILQDDEDVVSESAGVGRERVLVVKPKS